MVSSFSLRSLLLTVVFAVLLAPAGASHAQSVSVTIPDVSAAQGDTLRVPVSVGNLDAAADVTAYGFDLDLPADSLTYVGFDTASTLSDQAGFTVDDNPAVPRIGAFGSTPLSDAAASGVLLYLRFVVEEVSTAQVSLTNLQFNGGSPAASPARPAFRVTGTLPNLPPDARNDRYEATENQTLTITDPANGVTANDSDPNGDTFSLALRQDVSNGTLSFADDGTFTYTPDADFTGEDRFQYAATDPDGATATATVTISVEVFNTAPTLTPIPDQTIPEDGTTGPLAFTIGDAESSASSLSVRATSSTPALVPTDSLLLQGSGADRTLTVPPLPDANGTTTITLAVDDGIATTTQDVAVTVTPVNDAPVATDDAYRFSAGDTLRVTDPARALLGNDTDVDNSTLSASVVDSTAHGVITLAASGTFSYAPQPGFTGQDTLTYAVADPDGGSDTASAAFTVWPTDSVSVALDPVGVAPGDTARVPVRLGNLDRAADVTAFNFDIQFDDAAFTYVGPSTEGTLAAQSGFTVRDNREAARVGGFGSTPLNDAGTEGTLIHLQFVVAGEDTTTVALDNLQFNTGVPPARPARPTTTIISDFPNRAPRALRDRYGLVENQVLSITRPDRGVLRNDSDLDGDPLTASLVSDPSSGTLSFQSDGTFEYTPDTDFTGADSFRYRVADNDGRADSTTVDLTVAEDRTAEVVRTDTLVALRDTVIAPIRIERLDRTVDITSYGFDLDMDTSRVSYVGFETDSTLSKQAGFVVDDNPDLLRIGAFGSTPLNAEANEGVLLRLKFAAKATGETEIALSNLLFNGVPPARPVAPSFTIVAPTASDSSVVDSDGEFVFEGTGMRIVFSGVSGSGTVVVRKYGRTPASPEGISEENISSYHFQIETVGTVASNVASDGPSSSSTGLYDSATLRFDVSTLAGVNDAEDISIYRRDPGGTSFVQLSTTYNSNTNELITSSPRLGTFVFVSDTNPLPVELTDFDAQASGEAVALTWHTASETNNAGFEVQRRSNGPWEALTFVEGAGTTAKPQTYRFRDAAPPFADSLVYRLKQIDTDGTTAFSPEVVVRRGPGSDVQLAAPFPNPTRQQATVRYLVPEGSAQPVRLTVYNVLGQRVATLVDETQAPGREELSLDASRWASGVYFLRLQVGETMRSQRVTVVR